jgi:putative phosphoesterase
MPHLLCYAPAMPMVVGVISDTHGLLRPEALAALAGSDVIVHAGDIGAPEVLEALGRIARVIAVRGNNDRDAWAAAVPEEVVADLGGAKVCVIHQLAELVRKPDTEGIDVVISGHSHRPVVERRGGVLYINPGSAGPRRFSLPIAVARLQIGRGAPRAIIVELEVGAPRKAGARGVSSGRRSARPSTRSRPRS